MKDKDMKSVKSTHNLTDRNLQYWIADISSQAKGPHEMHYVEEEVFEV